MIAIETRYVGPTKLKPTRIIATTAEGHRHVISYPHPLAREAAHRRAATELAESMGWRAGGPLRLVSGLTKRGYAFVFVRESGQ